jgi:hypothetical protein
MPRTGNPGISLVFREIWDTTALSLWLSIHPIYLAVNLGGIPHLAKNERDMGHPSFVREPGTNVFGPQPPNILPIFFAQAQPHLQGLPKSERISG